MALPRTAQEIYDLLVVDEPLMDLLGSYTASGCDPVPAIGCFLQGQRLPEGTVVAGVEVAITGLGVPSPADLSMLFLLNQYYQKHFD